MGKENDVMMEFLRDKYRFADLFNGALFAGEQVVKADELERDSESYTEYGEKSTERKTDSGKGHDMTVRSRDVIKRLKSGTELRILSIEEQSYIDYTMPWRCMNYDALEYGRQIKDIQRRNKAELRNLDDNEFLSKFRQTDHLAPVYTICFYHGTEPWDGPRSLKDMMEFGSDVDKALWERNFSDYQMRLICVNELKDMSVFNTGLRELLTILQYRKDRAGMDKFLAEHEEYKRLDIDTARTIDVVMGVKKFMGNEERYRTEEGYDMCQAIREMWEDGVNLGISQGISQGIRNLMQNLNLTCDQAMDALGITDQEERRKYRKVGEKE